MKLFITRVVHISCTDAIGQIKRTFTKDENGKQNSPSFESYYDFCIWKNEVFRYSFRYDLEQTILNKV